MRPWARAAFAMFAVGWGANQFASLLLAYREHDGLSAADVDALFGFYAVGLIPALLIVGPLSDRLGRRRIARTAVLVSLLATAVLAPGEASIALLYAGRFLAGVASGMIFAPGTAWVKELSSPPFAPPVAGHEGAGARRAAVALSAGFGLGPLVAGAISQWAPAPLATPYLAHAAVGLVAAVLVWTVPETVHGGAGRVSFRAAGSRRFLRVVAPLAPWVFTAASVSIAVGPALVAERTGSFRIAFAGLVAGLTLGTGVLIQPAARRLAARGPVVPMAAGLLAIAAAAAVETGTALTGAPPLALAAAVLFGAGYGLCLVAGLLETQRIAPPGEPASLTAVYYALTYVGFAAPLVLTSLTRVAGTAVLLPLLGALALLTLAAVGTGAQAPPGRPSR